MRTVTWQVPHEQSLTQKSYKCKCQELELKTPQRQKLDQWWEEMSSGKVEGRWLMIRMSS